MANIDYAGLLTGISSQNQRPSPAAGSREQQLLGFAARQNEALTGRLGGMFGLQQQDPVELAKTKLVGLDPTNPADQPQFIQLLNIVDPGKAAQFKQQLEAKATSLTKSTSDANTVADALPAQYASLATAVRNKVPGAINAALGILGKVPDAPKIEQASLVDVATNQTVAGVELRNGIPYKPGTDTRLTPQELEGMAISKTYVKPPAALVNTAVDPEVQAAADRRQTLFDPLSTVVDTTLERAATAPTERTNAIKILDQVERDANTGTVQGMTSNFFKFAQSAYQTAGVPVPEGLTEKLGAKASYQKLSADGLLPRIAEQGRGFTDPERVFFLNEVLPSYNQTFQFNELSGNMQLADSKIKIEEAAFAQARRTYYINEDEAPKDTHAEAFSDYLTKLPVTKFEKHTREVAGQEVTYDRLVALQDNAKLYQYWTGGASPTGFVLGSKEENFTWDDLKITAEENNTTPRELLAQAQRTGNLIRATY